MDAEARALLLLAASGVFQAAFAVPAKYLRGWRWEQIWVAQSIAANVLFPLAWAAVAPAPFWSLATLIPWSHWVASYGWGLVWGIGGVAYGLTLARLGIAFSNSFIFGVTTVTGAALPLALKGVESPTRPGLFVLGLTLCLAATALIGFFQRHAKQESILAAPFSPPYGWTVAVAVLSGLFSAGYGLAFTFSYGIIRGLVAGGVSPMSASLVVVLPVYLGAATVAIPVGAYFAARSGTLSLFLGRHAGWNWWMALQMGLCAVATAVLYGWASTGAGHPSPNVSFGIFMTFLVLGGNVFGLATGEMRGPASNRAGLLLSAGALVAAAWLLDAS